MARRASKAKTDVFLVDVDALPQTKALLHHRAAAVGIRIEETAFAGELPEAFGAFVQYPGATGRVWDFSTVAETMHAKGGLVVAAADLLALTPAALTGRARRRCRGRHDPALRCAARLRRTPRRLHGRAGGPRASAAGPSRRSVPGCRRRPRLPPLAADARAAHPPREGDVEHLHRPGAPRRHGRDVRRLPRTRRPPSDRDAGRAEGRCPGIRSPLVRPDPRERRVLRHRSRARSRARAGRGRPRREGGYQLLWVDDATVGVSVDETTTDADISAVLNAFGLAGGELPVGEALRGVDGALHRDDEYLTHPVFHTHHSETAMMRYLKSLADRDYALDRGMIPLGSCTMKLNAATEMAAGVVAGVLARAPVRARGRRARLPRDDRPARALARRGDRLRCGVAAAECRFAG